MDERYERYKIAQQLYDSNEAFHKFVNRCCETYKYSIGFAFSVCTIQDVAEYYAGRKDVSELPPVNLEPCECEDKSC